MNSRHNSDQQKYKDAGEQAARVIGEFMSLANDFSRRFGSGFSERNPANDDTQRNRYGEFGNNYSTTDRSTAGDSASDNRSEGFQQAGEYLRELREAAGYSIDGFAQAMNRQNAASKIESVEAGRDAFPTDWLEQISTLLKQNEPGEFFDKLRSLYDAEPAESDSANSTHHAEASHKTSAVVSKRREKLNEIFSDDTLEDLSDSQFEELSGFIKTNYHAALQLVGKKPHD